MIIKASRVVVRVRRLVLCALLGLVVLPAAAAADDCTIPKKLGVVFVVDDSGSMAESDSTKLRGQATEIGIDSMPDGSIAAAGSFDTSARAFFSPTEVTAASRPELKSKLWFAAGGNTDYELAFEQAQAQLGAMTGVDKRAVVFLSDGIPTTSYSTDDDLARAGIPIFTIGFGDAPVAELAGIAARSGGQAYAIETPGDAQSAFGRIVARLTCDAAVTTSSVALVPGESKLVPFDVGPTDREFRALAAWGSGAVTVSLRRPDGTVMDASRLLAGEMFLQDLTYALGRGTNPAAGGWNVVLTAAADNIEAIDVVIDVFRRQFPTSPDPPQLVAPATGATGRAGDPLIVTWTPSRGASTYDILVDGQVAKSGLTGTTDTFAVPLALGPHTIKVQARNVFGTQASEGHQVTTTRRGTAVLVPGLGEDSKLLNGDAPPAADACAGLHDFATICQRLRSRGFAVWAPADRSGASGDEELDNKGDLDRNAAHLRAFAKRYLGDRRAFYIGHSMGGLIARKAISDMRLPAAGLFTLGTPHDGSFLADAAIGGSSLFCPLPVCKAIRTAAMGITLVFGPQALADMTRIARHDDEMRAPGVPTWALAGTAIDPHLPSWVPGGGYVFPNDLAVGRSSALGHSANLGIGDDHRFELPVWHLKKLGPLKLSADPAGHSEFDDGGVIDRLAGVADGLPALAPVPGPAAVRRATVAVAARGKKKAKKKARPVPVVSTVAALSTQEVGSSPSTADGMLFSDEPFVLTCSGQAPLPAIEIADGLVISDPSAAPCRRPRVAAGHGVDVVRSVDTARVRVRATFTSKGLRVRVTARVKMTRIGAQIGKRAARLRVRSRASKSLTADVVIKRGKVLRLEVVAAGRTYVAVVRR